MTAGAEKLAAIASPIMDRHYGIDPEATGAISVPILSGDEREALVAELAEVFDILRPFMTSADVRALEGINYHEAAEAVERVLTTEAPRVSWDVIRNAL